MIASHGRKNESSNENSAKNSTLDMGDVPLELDLIEVLNAWSLVPAAIKATVLATVRTPQNKKQRTGLKIDRRTGIWQDESKRIWRFFWEEER
jgi:hypothetical protein